jgi:hypothetical protein
MAYAALLLLAAAGGSPAGLPGPAEAATAWFELQANICRGLIDLCEGGVGVPSAAEIGRLRCAAGRPGFAHCRFRIADRSCRAAFVSAAAGPAHAWARQWSQLPEPSAQAWSVAWTRSPEPRGPRITCRAPD